MHNSHLRPPEEHVKEAYDQLTDSGTNFTKIRDAALADRLFPSPGTKLGIPGRSIAWKLFLVSEDPLQSSESLYMRRTSLLNNLQIYRQKYVKMLEEKMKAPDGSYEEGFVLPGSSTLPRRPSEGTQNLATNNPLSLDDENPWREWFASVELRKTILQDVERTFPDIGFFRNAEVQLQLTNILFLYSTLNCSVGYRQGMHEILAPIYYALDYDSIAYDGDSFIGDKEMRETCSRSWVAADAWALFNSVMHGLSKWYEWREPPQDLTPSAPSPFPNHVRLNIPDGPLNAKPYITPIVEGCNQIQFNLLQATDPILWKHMQATGIEPQIYGIRWLRLLFTREFNMEDAMKLWDGLFACDPTLELARWICVAMLIRIRNELIPSDYNGQLSILLRYPSPQPSLDGTRFHTSLLLQQALALQMSPTPATGTSLMIENRNVLNIPLEVPSPLLRGRNHGSREGISAMSGRTEAGTAIHGHSKQQLSNQMRLPEMIARGLLERGESLGINKTLMSAVSELKRNIPDLAASLVRSPGTSFSTFPLTDEKTPDERPPWEPRTRLEMERDILQLRSTNKRLGESLGWIVDVLLQDETGVDDLRRLQKRKREALESLSYIRDTLIGNVVEVEETRLLSEEELLKRSLRKDLPNHSVVVPPPAPMPVIDSRKQSTNTQRSRLSPHSSMSVLSGSGFSALSPPANTEGSSVSGLTAPWNHSRSMFSGSVVPLPGEALPRLPPPTWGLKEPSQDTFSRQKVNDQTLHRIPARNDPLGALG